MTIADICPEYVAREGYNVSECNGKAATSVCYLSCAPGYSGNPPDAVCMHDGEWSEVGGCSGTYISMSIVMSANSTWCKTYVAPAGYVKTNCNSRAYNATCFVGCSYGYEISSENITDPICQFNATWSEPKGCVRTACGPDCDNPSTYLSSFSSNIRQQQ